MDSRHSDYDFLLLVLLSSRFLFDKDSPWFQKSYYPADFADLKYIDATPCAESSSNFPIEIDIMDEEYDAIICGTGLTVRDFWVFYSKKIMILKLF